MNAERPENIVRNNFGAGAAAVQLDLFCSACHWGPYRFGGFRFVALLGAQLLGLPAGGFIEAPVLHLGIEHPTRCRHGGKVGLSRRRKSGRSFLRSAATAPGALVSAAGDRALGKVYIRKDARFLASAGGE